MEFVGQMLWQGLERIYTGDPTVWATTSRTLQFALLSTLIALVLGLPLALWLGGAATRARRIGLTVANAGLGFPPVVLGVFLALLFTPFGPLGFLNWLYSFEGIVAAQVVLALPLIVALSAAAVAALPAGLLQQASAFGASRWRVGMLALREARVGVVAAVIAGFGSALAEVGAIIIVGGNIRGQTNTLGSTVLLDLNASDPAGATALALVLAVLVLLSAATFTVLQQRATR